MASTIVPLDVLPLYITSNKTVQAHCLSIITRLYYYIHGYLKISKDDCRIFLRGSNAIPIIKGMLNNRNRVSYAFTSDFDIEVVINPKLSDDEFNSLHKSILDEILYFFISIANYESLWEAFRTAAHKYGISVPPLNTNMPIYVRNGYTNLDKKLLETTKKYGNISKYSPFYVYKVNDIAPPILPQIGVSQVKFGIRVPSYESKGYPYKSLDLIDVSIPKKSYEYLPKLWDYANNDIYMYSSQIEGFPRFYFPVLNLPASIQNMEYAAKESKEPRSKKRNTRKKAANSLRTFYRDFVKRMPPSNIRNKTIRRVQNLGVVLE